MTSLHSVKAQQTASTVWSLASRQQPSSTQGLEATKKEYSPLEVRIGRSWKEGLKSGTGFSVSLPEEAVRPPEPVHVDPQRNFAEGVVVTADGKTVLCAITSLNGEPKIALPQALFPVDPTEGSSFRIRMALDADGFRTPEIEMVAIQPSEEVAAIHREIDGLLAMF